MKRNQIEEVIRQAQQKLQDWVDRESLSIFPATPECDRLMTLMDEAVLMGARIAFGEITGLRDQNEELQTMVIELEEECNEMMKHIHDALTALFANDVEVARSILLTACEADNDGEKENEVN